ncbi:MAG: transcriptional regulator [Clostridiales bacterium]|nr:transcriptional regulator [Clostridiales bacterium]
MTSKNKTKLDYYWDKLFDKYDILDEISKNGFFEITSTQINEFREARLMTKFDHRSNLPVLFKDNDLSILPITRGNYIISNFEAYHDFEPANKTIHKITYPTYIESIDFGNITSESLVINTAYLTGMIADFTEEEGLLPTINGRMGSESFDFQIYNKTFNKLQTISIDKSQLEIDGGYENVNSLTLLEAKNSISDDFIVRQLYYPYRLFKDKVTKPIKPIYLTYSNGIFYFYEYMFEDSGNYNSLVLVKQKNYTLESEDISFDELVAICHQIQLTSEPYGVPFPQANSFNRVVNICELLFENETLTRDEITLNYDFDVRQTHYYTDACRYLGLVEKQKDHFEGVRYYLTDKGKALFSLNIKKRNLQFARYILEKRVFNEAFKMYIKHSELPSKEDIVKIMKNAKLYNVRSDSTFFRRSSTVLGWLKWIIDLVN